MNKTSRSQWRKYLLPLIKIRDRNRSLGGSDIVNNYNNMRPAGGAVNLDPNNRKPTVDDGKNRLFGFSDENSVPLGQQQIGQSKNTGKKILQAGNSANTYTNVIGGSYGAEGGYDSQPVQTKA